MRQSAVCARFFTFRSRRSSRWRRRGRRAPRPVQGRDRPLGGGRSIRARLTRVVLEGEGNDVLTARRGAEALDIAAAHPGETDLLVSDVMMPGMTGPEVPRHLVQRIPGLRVGLMSGHTGEAIPEALVDGFDSPTCPSTPTTWSAGSPACSRRGEVCVCWSRGRSARDRRPKRSHGETHLRGSVSLRGPTRSRCVPLLRLCGSA